MAPKLSIGLISTRNGIRLFLSQLLDLLGHPVFLLLELVYGQLVGSSGSFSCHGFLPQAVSPLPHPMCLSLSCFTSISLTIRYLGTELHSLSSLQTTTATMEKETSQQPPPISHAPDDSRAHYRVDEDIEFVGQILATRPPRRPRTGFNPGLDYLIMVLRRIYAHMMLGRDNLAGSDWVKRAEEENPILRHAWHMFGTSVEELQRASQARHGLLKSLREIDGLDITSFEELHTCDLMCRPFWSQSDFSLYDPRHSLDPFELDELKENEIAHVSLLRLNRHENPGQTLRALVDKSYGIFDIDGRSFLYSPHMPLIVRLEYTPESDPSTRLSFDSLRVLDLPEWTLCTVNGRHRFRTSGRNTYALIAAVRKRDAAMPQDSVQTFNIDGSDIIPEYRTHCTRKDAWSVEDATPATLVLFFGLVPGGVAMDTKPTRRRVNPETEKLAEEALPRYIAPLSEPDRHPNKSTESLKPESPRQFVLPLRQSRASPSRGEGV